MTYNQRKNTDDIFVRSIYVGIINVLNNQIFYENVLGPNNDEYDIVEIPFFPSTTDDERYLQDFFLNWNDCNYPKKVDGNIDPLPRGVVTLDGMNIDTSALTQRWIRGEFAKNIDGRIETYNAYINSLPMNMTFNVEIRTDTMVEAFKAVQAILDTFYKVRVFNVNYRGFMIPCQVTFPEDYPVEKTLEFSYPSDNLISLSFTLEVETYYPVVDEPNIGSDAGRELLTDGDGDVSARRLSQGDFDKVLKRRRGGKYYETEDNGEGNIYDNLSNKTASIRSSRNTMDDIIIERENDHGHFINYKHIPTLYLLSPTINDTIQSQSTIEIQWKFDGWLDKVNGYYSEDYGNTWIEIMRFYDAHKESYMWKVPNLTQPIDAVIVTERKVFQQARVKLFTDINGSIVNYAIQTTGQGYDDNTTIEIEENGTDAIINPVIQNGKIVSLDIINGGSGYTPSMMTEIAIMIRSSADKNVFDTTKDNEGNLGVIKVI